MKIVFPHIPKCAGSSIKSQLLAIADTRFDYVNHPTWIYEPDIQLGAVKQAEMKAELGKLDNWIVFGHFGASDYDDIPYDLKIVLIREPLQRAVSHFHYVKQALPDTEVTRRRHKEVAQIKGGTMSIDSFAQLNHIRFFYGNYYLRGLILDSRLLVLPVEDLSASFNKIKQKCGLSLDASVHHNQSSYEGTFGNLYDLFDDDRDLYNNLISRP